MSSYQVAARAFAVKLSPTATLAELTSFTAATVLGPGPVPAGTHYYKVLPCLEYTGTIHAAPAGPVSRVVPAGGVPYVRLSWAAYPVPGARVFKVYRSTSSGGTYYLLGYASGNEFYDRWTSPRSETLTAAANNTDSDVVYDFRRVGGTMTHAKLAGRPLGFELCDVSEPSYSRISPADHQPGSTESIQHELIRQEAGERVSFVADFQAFLGSEEDDALRAIYSARSAFPEQGEPGVKIFATLDYRGGGVFDACSTWMEVEILGDWEPRMLEDKRARYALSWTFLARKPMNGIPLAGALADLVAGRGTWGEEF